MEDLSKRITELEKQLSELKNRNQELESEKEKLENRFGLVWRDVPEKFIKYISDNEVLYGKGVYKLIKEEVSCTGKNVVLEVYGSKQNLVRQSDSYLFKSKETNEVFLLHSNKLYQFEKETYEQYVPILEDKGEDFFIGDNDRNVLIEGDNYYALQILQYTHRDKIDFIYIDPPYNTGKGDFSYNDKFIDSESGSRHSSWLSFIKKRLKLINNLITVDGFIAISIDGNEMERLKLLCDEVFGEKNHLLTIPVINNLKGRNDTGGKSGGFSTVHEYLVVFCKNKEKTVINDFIDMEIDETKIKHDSIGAYMEGKGLKRTGNDAPRNKRPNGYFPIYVSEDMVDLSTEYFKNSIEVFPLTNGNEMSWTWSKEKFEKEKSEIIIKSTSNGISFYKKQRLDITSNSLSKSTKPKSVFYDPKYSIGTTEFKTLGFSSAIFQFPKSIKLISDIIHIATSHKKSPIILDFFAGSGTTGHAVWELNKEDGGNRKFILVTNNENNICEDVTFERLKRANSERHGNYNESLKYLRIRHVQDRNINEYDTLHNLELLKEIVNLKFNSFKVIEENEYWYVTEKFALLKNIDKKEEFFNKFKNYKNYALIDRKKRKFQEFLEIAKNHTSEENIYHMSKDYLDNIKKQISREG